MTENPAKREAITGLFDAARVNGVAYLLAILALGSATIPELVDMTGDERHTIGRYLSRLESREFLIRVPSGRYERWFPTPKALALFGVGVHPLKVVFLPSTNRVDIMEEGILPSTLPSSSDPGSDQDQSDLVSEEEEEASRKEKCLQLRRYNLTGAAVQQLVADSWVTPQRLVAWLHKVKAMQRAGFEFHKSPEAYAIMCLRRHHEPPADYLSAAQKQLQAGSDAPEAPPDADISVDISPSLPRLPASDPDRAAQQTWQIALGELQLQMTRPTFETYVKPAVLVACDLHPPNSPDPLFTLAVENAHLRDWLETKMLTSIRRALSGITHRPIHVRIITWSEAQP